MSLFCSVNPVPSISFRLLAFTHALQSGNITARSGTYSAVLYTAAAHLHNMGDADTATRCMATCARLQYAAAPQPNIMCALGSIIAAQGQQRDLVAHAPSPVVFAHGLHALHAASSFALKQANGSRTAPAPNILGMTLKQFGSAARCVCVGRDCGLFIYISFVIAVTPHRWQVAQAHASSIEQWVVRCGCSEESFGSVRVSIPASADLCLAMMDDNGYLVPPPPPPPPCPPFLLTFLLAAAAAHYAQLLHVCCRRALSWSHEMRHAFISNPRPPKARCRRSSCSSRFTRRLAAAALPSPAHRWVSALRHLACFQPRFSEAAAVRYMSSDWDAHATAHLIKRAMLAHSSAVRAVVISLTPGEAVSARASHAPAVMCTRGCIAVEFECGVSSRCSAGDESGWKREMATKLTVVEISPSMDAGEAAAVIQKHRVLVLVNLNGWTLHDRNDVFALQPSPVQV